MDTNIQNRHILSFTEFARHWFQANGDRMKQSYREFLISVTDRYLIPFFGCTEITKIRKQEVLDFRQSLMTIKGTNRLLSSGTINHIMLPLRLIMGDAASTFGFDSPCETVASLHVRRPVIDPFSLHEVKLFLNKIRQDYYRYYLLRFLTGMRDSEINGLKWKYIDFESRAIKIREIQVSGRQEQERRPELRRDILIGDAVYKALREQIEVSGVRSEFVFCSRVGTPLSSGNITTQIWHPALENIGLRKRRPYQTRHTAATLWLAAGENPLWVAEQLGQSNFPAFISTYRKFIPNIGAANNGSAFDSMLARHLNL